MPNWRAARGRRPRSASRARARHPAGRGRRMAFAVMSRPLAGACEGDRSPVHQAGEHLPLRQRRRDPRQGARLRDCARRRTERPLGNEDRGLHGHRLLHEPGANDGLDPALDAWMARALAREPDVRFTSAKEMSDAFAVAVRGIVPVSAADATIDIRSTLPLAQQRSSGPRALSPARWPSPSGAPLHAVASAPTHDGSVRPATSAGYVPPSSPLGSSTMLPSVHGIDPSRSPGTGGAKRRPLLAAVVLSVLAVCVGAGIVARRRPQPTSNAIASQSPPGVLAETGVLSAPTIEPPVEAASSSLPTSSRSSSRRTTSRAAASSRSRSRRSGSPRATSRSRPARRTRSRSTVRSSARGAGTVSSRPGVTRSASPPGKVAYEAAIGAQGTCHRIAPRR